MRAVHRFASALFASALLANSSPRAATAADPGASQLASWSQLCGAVAAGTFHWSGATPSNCTALPNRMIAWSDFTNNVTHTGSGCGTGNPLPFWSQLLTCRGPGVTQTSQAISGQGITYTTDGTTCTSSGTSSVTFVTPSSTAAPTSGTTQLTLSLSSVAQYSADAGSPTGTGITYSLTAPGGGAIYSNVAVTNGATPFTLNYSNGAAAAGPYTWTIGGLGSETCTGLSPNKHVNNASAESFGGSIKWFQ